MRGRLSVGDRRVIGRVGRARLAQAGLGAARRLLIALQFLLRDPVGLDQTLVAIEVLMGERHLRLLRGDVGLIAGLLREQLDHIPDGLGETGPCLGEGDIGVVRIEAHQQLAAVHGLGLVGGDFRHRAADLWRKLHQITVHVGIRRVDVVASDGQVIDQHDDAEQQQDTAEDADEQPVALRVVLLLLGFPGLLVLVVVIIIVTHGGVLVGSGAFHQPPPSALNSSAASEKRWALA